jgi:UDP-glucose 4-epimerase
MAKVLVTGVAGFLGSHLAERLVREGHTVVGVDNLIGGYLDNVPKGIEFWQEDCRDRLLMKKRMEGVDIVYHCAAAAYEGLSVFSPQYINEHTYMTTVALLSAAAEAKIKRFVFLSSMARYGEQQTPFTEDMSPAPCDPYGVAKVAAEFQTRILCETHGIEWVIAVPHNIIGPRQKYDDPYRNVASIMINRILMGKEPIIYGDGEQKRCFSFIEDVVNPLMKLGFEKNVVGEIINIGPDEEFVTINELADVIRGLLDFKGSYIHVPDRPREVKLATCSADKARRLLGYRTTTSLRDGLQEIVTYIKKRGVKQFEYHIPLEINNDLTPKTWKEKLM